MRWLDGSEKGIPNENVAMIHDGQLVLCFANEEGSVDHDPFWTELRANIGSWDVLKLSWARQVGVRDSFCRQFVRQLGRLTVPSAVVLRRHLEGVGRSETMTYEVLQCPADRSREGHLLDTDADVANLLELQ